MNFDCCKTKKLNIKPEQTAEFLKVIAEPNRLKILCLLQKQKMCVCEIWQYLDLPQNLTSYHLKVLEGLGLISSERKGSKIIYSINGKALKKYLKLLNKFLKIYE